MPSGATDGVWSQGQFGILSDVNYQVMFDFVRSASVKGYIAIDDIVFTPGTCQSRFCLSEAVLTTLFKLMMS
ncbi:hypothetical protein DPMN_011699 [Dreissena polymorpha]|uniref:MAM domain-containing protein n=1 Tax=Dreissena polymorpha TaxID=45954 RepID=A0A9D4N4I0_DREPO|nr:hypothetical protein DPMN_011699 [Dreissena polymorpha]